MATDVRVVIPADMGETIVLGKRATGKYDVDESKLNLPDSITSLDLSNNVLTITTPNGDKTVDLSPLIPAVVTELFLKEVALDGNKLKFTVGEEGSTASDNVIEIDVSDLIPVTSDGITISGDGTAASPLKTKLSSSAGNLLKSDSTGLYVSSADVSAAAPPPPSRDVRLVNASGTTVVGYLFDSETE